VLRAIASGFVEVLAAVAVTVVSIIVVTALFIVLFG
jgi:hypothetical protein